MNFRYKSLIFVLDSVLMSAVSANSNQGVLIIAGRPLKASLKLGCDPSKLSSYILSDDNADVPFTWKPNNVRYFTEQQLTFNTQAPVLTPLVSTQPQMSRKRSRNVISMDPNAPEFVPSNKMQRIVGPEDIATDHHMVEPGFDQQADFIPLSIKNE